MRLIMACQGEAGSDGNLSAEGTQQAHAIAGEVRRLMSPDALPESMWCSPDPAAFQTAAVLNEELGQPPVAVESDLQGPTEPELIRLLQEEPQHEALLQHLDELRDRAWAIISSVVSLESDAVLVLVTDPVAIAAIVCQMLAMPIADHNRMRIDAGSVSVIQFGPRRTLLASLNDTCHLESLSPA